MRIKLGLLGWPVGHSLSPRLFEILARRLKRDLSYRAIPLPPAELVGELESLAADGYLGVNVTIPHKRAAAALMRSLTPEAQAIGAVNTVRFSGGGAKGHNTDAPGFLDALRAAGFSPKGRTAVVFGAGGAARAAVWALVRARAQVTVCARRAPSAGALAKELGAQAGPARAADLWVNATPLGMDGMPDEAPAQPARCAFAFDMVYGRETAFLRQARAAGAKTEGGLAMLIFQALRGWEFWFGPLGEGRRRSLAGEVAKEIEWAG